MRVVYFRQMGWHSRSSLQWFCSSSLLDGYATKFSWSNFVSACVELTHGGSQAVCLVLDCIAADQQAKVCDAVLRINELGGVCAAIMCGNNCPPRCEEVRVFELTHNESIEFVHAVLADMTVALPEKARYDPQT